MKNTLRKKILITGFSGFVASHFVEFLYNEKLGYDICGIDLKKPFFNYSIFSDRLNISFVYVDMTQLDSVRDVINKFRPNYILHLAAYSSVAYSWNNPVESFMNNSNIFLNLVSAVKEVCPECRILSVGSSEEYGNVKKENLPITENHEINPLSPYAVARVSQEMLSKVFIEAYQMPIILTRSFNHIGPRQDNRFVIPSFIEKMLEIKEKGKKEGKIRTGNLSIIRDFVDVRDVVVAYYLLLSEGRIGEVYNICSGIGIQLRSIIDIIADNIGLKIETVIDNTLIRPKEIMEIIGDPSKIENEMEWNRKYSISRTIQDMIQEMKNN